MVLVRKSRAGSDSLGHVWVHDGDIVEVPHDQALALLAIRDAGFVIVEPEQASADPASADTGMVTRGRARKPAEKTEIAENAP